MHVNTATVDAILKAAISAMRRGEEECLVALDQLPAPVYVADAAGMITHYNRACIDFAGRTPQVGQDRWCVTWKLYTEDGRDLPHDQCPMAVAIRERRLVRGIEAVAERPDGTRVPFMPFPTPLLNEDGSILGAVNILLDMSQTKQAHAFREQAARCRRLVHSVSDQRTTAVLSEMAAEYDEKALKLEQDR